MRDEYDWEGEKQPIQSWRFPFTWLGLIAAGWIIFELTAQPALGVIVISLKSGWENFKTAVWLYRMDNHRQRGFALSCAYFALGMWQTAAVSFFILVALLATVFDPGPNAQQARGAEKVGDVAFIIVLSAFLASSVATVFSICLARWSRFKIWLDFHVSASRKQHNWPPNLTWHAAVNAPLWMKYFANKLWILYGTSAYVLGWLAFIICLENEITGVRLVPVLVLGIPVLLITVRSGVAVYALAPSDCWPEQLPTEAPALVKVPVVSTIMQESP